MTQPLEETASGVAVWAVPGCDPGRRFGLLHLTWGGPHDAIHFHTRGTARGGRQYPGWDTGTVSGLCRDIADAQHAVAAYLTSLGRELAAAADGSIPPRTTGLLSPVVSRWPSDPFADPFAGAPAPAQATAAGTPSGLDEILRVAGDISPATAERIRVSAHETYRQYSVAVSEAWAQHAARNAAETVLANVATESRPVVQAAFRRYQDAAEQANRLLAAAGGTGGARGAGTADNRATGSRLDAVAARHEAAALGRTFRNTFTATKVHYAVEVRKAWRQADKDFLVTHLAALEAADPAGFARQLRESAEDSAPSAGRGGNASPTRSPRTRPGSRQAGQQAPRKARGR
jgi:hypothetical protein